MRQYIALIHKDAESDFGVSFPDLPGCVAAGATLDEARDMAAEALALHLEGMAEDGEALPEPSSLEAVMADAANREGVAILVAAPPEAVKAIRVNVTLPEDVLIKVDAYATANGYYPFRLPRLCRQKGHDGIGKRPPLCGGRRAASLGCRSVVNQRIAPHLPASQRSRHE
jgi:predicted RNase H-like HicB family nuclease